MEFIVIATLVLVALVTVVVAQVKQDWWVNCNLYQIYPRSFKDSDGDGIGDLNGITEKLQYFKDIGIDAVWLSPIFKSPMADFGYDISDYYAVQQDYGTNLDLKLLFEEAHKIGLRVILDFVPNHTSDEHEWFIRSENGDAKYRDFYIWHDGVWNATTGKHDPPSNWVSAFRYSSWQWSDKRQQYYLHQFGVKQPDLNFRNPAVLEALEDVMYYWLSMGIDGFRLDAVNFLFEADIDPRTGTYPDEPPIDDVSTCPDPNDWCHLKHIYTKDLDESTQIVYRWRKLVDDWKRVHNTDTIILLTEAYVSLEMLMDLYGTESQPGAQVSFNFHMFRGLNNQSTAADYEYYAKAWLNNMPKGAVANWVLGNHDNARVATRFGVQRTDLINIFLQTLPGIAVTYYGEELGMEDVFVPFKDTIDIQGCNAGPEHFLQLSRDPVRTPFRWDSSKNAGFSTGNHTWLPVGEGYKENNVDAQLKAKNSHLKIFQDLIHLRKTEPAFDEGGFESRVVDNVLLYRRKASTGDAFIIILNIGDVDLKLDLSAYFDDVPRKVKVVLSSLQSGIKAGKSVKAAKFKANAYLGYVLRLKGKKHLKP